MSDTPSLIERLHDEADLCKSEGADDIARLLDEAGRAISETQNELEYWKRRRAFDAHCSYCGEVANNVGSAEEALRIAHEHGLTCPKDPRVSYAEAQRNLLERALNDHITGTLAHDIRAALAKNQCGGSGSLSETPRPSTAHPLPAGLKPDKQLDGGPSASGPATQPEPRTICHETGRDPVAHQLSRIEHLRIGTAPGAAELAKALAPVLAPNDYSIFVTEDGIFEWENDHWNVRLEPIDDELRHQVGRNASMEEMVDRFLSWKLPRDFGPDCGITFKPPEHPNSWPVGTNLLNAVQARTMLEQVVKPGPEPVTPACVSCGATYGPFNGIWRHPPTRNYCRFEEVTVRLVACTQPRTEKDEGYGAILPSRNPLRAGCPMHSCRDAGACCFPGNCDTSRPAIGRES